MHCRHCGQDINEKAEYCVHCGCRPLSGIKFCQECGIETNENQEVCIKCGVKLLKQKANIANKVEQENLDFSYLDRYWQDEFTKINESEESYNGKWNWPAFFFSWIWAFVKGCWVLGLVGLIASIASSGILAIPLGIYCGIRGNKIHYNKHVKNQQTAF